MTNDAKARSDRINNEMLDSWDEELELEIEDYRLPGLPRGCRHPSTKADPRLYFKQLFRLQGELVRLQDWGGGTKNSRWSSCSRGETPPERAASSSASRSASTRASAASPRCPLPMIASAPSGISSATWGHLPAVRRNRAGSTAAGTIEPALSEAFVGTQQRKSHLRPCESFMRGRHPVRIYLLPERPAKRFSRSQDP